MKSLAGYINVGEIEGLGILGLEGRNPNTSGDIFNTLLSTIVGVLTVIGFIWFVIQFLLGAVGIVTSGGDKAALESSRKKLSTGLLGVIVVISAVFLIDLVGYIIGIDLLGGASFISLLAP